jgi:ribosomal protein L7Ae-like RNA K-turn-binding protein
LSSIQTAVEKRLFAKAFKQEVQVRNDIAELIDKLLDERALQALAITKKSGLLLTGFSKVDSAIRAKTVKLLLHASDAAEDGKRKLSSATAFVVHMGGKETPVASLWSCDELSAALGLGNVMHAAALPGGATTNLMAAIDRLTQYRM